MSNAEDDQSPDDKEHDPSQKRIDDARRQGDIAKSADLTAAAAYGGLLLAGVGGIGVLGMAAQAGMILLEQAPGIAAQAAEGARPVVGGIIIAALPCALFLLLPAATSLAALLAQRALVFAPEKLAPKLSRISPWSMAKQKFGRDGLFEFAKSFLKLVLVGVVLGWFLTARADMILATAALEPRLGLIVLGQLAAQFLGIVVLVSAGVGLLDYLWQRQSLLRRNRMSRKDMTDEMKESDGDPQAKAQRRQRGQEIAMNQMLAEVPKASVVIVNPTHYAVALAWQRGGGTAPAVVAKGVDEMARRIREIAAEHGVPIHRDPPAARAIHATVDVGAPIRPDHFRAVAAAIRFAETMRRHAKRVRG